LREEEVDGRVSVDAILIANGNVGLDGAVDLDHDLLPVSRLWILLRVLVQYLLHLLREVFVVFVVEDELDLVPDGQQSLAASTSCCCCCSVFDVKRSPLDETQVKTEDIREIRVVHSPPRSIKQHEDGIRDMRMKKLELRTLPQSEMNNNE